MRSICFALGLLAMGGAAGIVGVLLLSSRDESDVQLLSGAATILIIASVAWMVAANAFAPRGSDAPRSWGPPRPGPGPSAAPGHGAGPGAGSGLR